jgi:IMP dehydrogenase
MAKYHISGIPVVDSENHLIGIITNRDLKFEHDYSKSVEEVMTPTPLVTGAEGTTIQEAEDFGRE